MGSKNRIASTKLMMARCCGAVTPTQPYYLGTAGLFSSKDWQGEHQFQESIWHAAAHAAASILLRLIVSITCVAATEDHIIHCHSSASLAWEYVLRHKCSSKQSVTCPCQRALPRLPQLPRLEFAWLHSTGVRSSLT